MGREILNVVNKSGRLAWELNESTLPPGDYKVGKAYLDVLEAFGLQVPMRIDPKFLEYLDNDVDTGRSLPAPWYRAQWEIISRTPFLCTCLLYTSDAADE